jgi:hypothetical protein
LIPTIGKPALCRSKLMRTLAVRPLASSNGWTYTNLKCSIAANWTGWTGKWLSTQFINFPISALTFNKLTGYVSSQNLSFTGNLLFHSQSNSQKNNYFDKIWSKNTPKFLIENSAKILIFHKRNTTYKNIQNSQRKLFPSKMISKKN